MEIEMKIKILGFTFRGSGCGYHRVVLPLQNMGGVEGSVINNLEAVTPAKYDILFFNRLNRFCDGDLDRARKLFGCRVVVDIDDYWRLPVGHLYYDQYLKHDGPLIEANIRQADLVCVTNARLAEKVYPLNKNVEIFPNALPFGRGQFNEEKEPSDKTRIFWAGGSTHGPDLEILKGPLKRLKSHADKITMTFGGYYVTHEGEREIWEPMAKNFTAGFQLPFEIYPAVPPDHYLDLYRHADVCLIPLRESDWNGYKSNLKILEAAVKKTPAIVSAVAPYIDNPDAPVLWVKNQSEWYQNIKKLIHDKKEIETMGNALNEWGRKNFDLEPINARRRAAFAKIAGA
jgi:hypothetical protein